MHIAIFGWRVGDGEPQNGRQRLVYGLVQFRAGGIGPADLDQIFKATTHTIGWCQNVAGYILTIKAIYIYRYHLRIVVFDARTVLE